MNTGTFTVTRSGDTAEALTVAYTVNGTATNGVDYVELSGTVERAKLGHYHRHSY